MRATVTSVQTNGTFESQFGVVQSDPDKPNHGKKLMHKFEITIGEHTGEYATNKYLDKEAKDFPFVVGVETDYEFVDGQYPKIKLPKKDFNPSNAYNSKPMDSNVQLMIVRQSSLKVALDVTVFNSRQNVEGSSIDELEIIELAERLTKWVMQPDSKSEKKEEPKPQSATSELMGESTELPSDDLPF